jgi:hypothetical protein
MKYVYIDQHYQGPKDFIQDIKHELYREMEKPPYARKMSFTDTPTPHYGTEVFEVRPDGTLVFIEGDYDSSD